MLYQTIDTASQFRDQFSWALACRGRGHQFSYAALGLIFDFINEGSDIELDVVAICCEYAEDTPKAIAENYSIDTEGLDEGEIKDAVLKHLEDNTVIVGETSSGSFVYIQF